MGQMFAKLQNHSTVVDARSRSRNESAVRLLVSARAFASAVGLAACGVLATGTAMGQDSVSRNANGGSGLPGDALTAWTSSSQRTNYVVDLAPLTTSWGTQFGIAPIAKSSRITVSRFNAINLASSISSDVRVNAPYPASAYTRWTQPGGGMSVLENNTSLNSVENPTGNATILGVGFMDVEETGSGSSVFFSNQVVGSLLAFDPAVPTRLFVTRVMAANNSATSTSADTAQFGYGAVDASGNLVFRADGFGVTSATNPLVGDNLFRVRLGTRSGLVNLISSLGGSDAPSTDRLLNSDAATHNTPNLVPASVAGRSILMTPNFLGQLRLESSANTTSVVTSHRIGTADHRGGVSVLAKPLFPGSVAAGAMLSRLVTPTSRTVGVSVWGIDSNGTPLSSRVLTLPATLTDPCDAFAWPVSSGEFRNYDSQVTFRGGTAPVAIAQDATGKALVAATVYRGAASTANNPFNAIAVARFDPSAPGTPVTWTLAAWVDSIAMDGKDILADGGLDGVPGTGDLGDSDGLINTSDAPIGRLAALTETSLGLTGPSMSAPAFDSAGNVYFLSSISAKRLNGASIVNESTIGLIRGVYNSSNLCYQLELVCRVGDQFAGANSGRNYRLETLYVADSDSVSSSSLWAGSVNGQPWNGQAINDVDTASPRHLGGLVLSARIVYDTNADGLFQDPTLPGGVSTSPDEAYNVALYIGNTDPGRCPADWNNDGGVDGDDVIEFFSEWDLGDADFNGDGGTDGDDVIAFFQRWDTGC